MPDQLVLDLSADGQAALSWWPVRAMPEQVARFPLMWPLDGSALEQLRWYLEDYLAAPFGVWEERGPAVQQKLAAWGDQVFGSAFGNGPARDAYRRARERGLEVVVRSAEPALLGLPWELMRDGAGPVALETGGVSRSLPAGGGAGILEVPDGRLRVLMVISRPRGTSDVGYQMVARPLLERLEAVRGEVDLTVLRPPTFDALADAVGRAAKAGSPFHVVHFDGHGVMPARAAGDGIPGVAVGPEGALAFELPGWGSHYVRASKFAAALAEGRVPVVVLNACQSGAMGKDLEASVATALLRSGRAAVVAMAYSVYAVAAAEFMAAFYESLFAGDRVGEAVTAGRRRLRDRDGRPSPRGDMPLADWLVPVHYMRDEVRFPGARTKRPAAGPTLDSALDGMRAAPPEDAATPQDPLAAVGPFVGRDDLFYQLEAAQGQGAVVLVGPGGTGKTELAKAFARWQRDTGGIDDPRLVLWHSFESEAAGLDGVIAAIGLAVIGADFARLDEPTRLAAVKRLLAKFRALLVWDNFESVREMPGQYGAANPLDEAGCERLREFLAWIRDHSASTVLITSRAREDWLGDAARITVGGLSRAEAAQYATRLLAAYPAARRRRERRPFGELLEWLDGHPLAMRLTLPRLEAADPAALLAGLRNAAPLPGAGEGQAGRLSSLEACVAYSYAYLPSRARLLLPVVSLLHGVADEDVLATFSCAPGAPARFAGAGHGHWSAALQEAARIGLLTGIGDGMYRLHPALPGYLAARWRVEDPGGSERAASEQALRAACAALGRWLTEQVAAGDAAFAHALLGLQRQNLTAMLGHALDHRAWADADSIVRALTCHWDARGLGTEAAAWGDRILAATAGPDQDAAGPARTLRLYAVGRQAERQRVSGRPEQAARTYEQTLEWLREQPETEWTRKSTATACHQLGNAAFTQGRLDKAEDWYRKALAIREDLGDRPELAGTYHQLGMIAQGRKRLDEAEDWYRKALALEADLGDRPKMASTCEQIGAVARDRGRLEEAERWVRKALVIREDIGDRPGLANAYHQLGSIAQLAGRLAEAEDWYREALIITEGLGDRPRMAVVYHQLGINAHRRDRPEEAEAWYRKALAIEAELGDRPKMAKTATLLGLVAQTKGRLAEAEGWYRRTLKIQEELRDRDGMAAAYVGLSALALAREQPRRALEAMIRCVTLFDQFPHPATGPVPADLAALARRLGMPAVEQAWRQVAGRPVPRPVRRYIASQRESAR
jgi:tetratricopeptide (TPR) repeat protein